MTSNYYKKDSLQQGEYDSDDSNIFNVEEDDAVQQEKCYISLKKYCEEYKSYQTIPLCTITESKPIYISFYDGSFLERLIHVNLYKIMTCIKKNDEMQTFTIAYDDLYGEFNHYEHDIFVIINVYISHDHLFIKVTDFFKSDTYNPSMVDNTLFVMYENTKRVNDLRMQHIYKPINYI